MEIKNKLIVTRRDGGGAQQGKEGEGSSRNMYKGLMDKDKKGIEYGRWWWVGQGRVMGGGKWNNFNCTTIKKI